MAGVMLVMGLGRLGLWTTAAVADALPVTVYGWLLVSLGTALLLSIPWRLVLGGRILAGTAAVLLVGMVWDGGHISVTLLIETWLAFSLAVEALSRNYD